MRWCEYAGSPVHQTSRRECRATRLTMQRRESLARERPSSEPRQCDPRRWRRAAALLLAAPRQEDAVLLEVAPEARLRLGDFCGSGLSARARLVLDLDRHFDQPVPISLQVHRARVGVGLADRDGEVFEALGAVAVERAEDELGPLLVGEGDRYVRLHRPLSTAMSPL